MKFEILSIVKAMVEVGNQNFKDELSKLPEFIQKEWLTVTKYFSKKSECVLFEEFKKRYDNFEGTTIEELICIPELYIEWVDWKSWKGFDMSFPKSLTEVLNDFKLFWQYDSEETKVMFKEMRLLSENLLGEWRYEYKYNNDDCLSKVRLWEEFKNNYEIDVLNYNEEKYNEMVKYIDNTLCDNTDYFEEYPRNFFDYREDSNYHSFDDYPTLKRFEICESWNADVEGKTGEKYNEMVKFISATVSDKSDYFKKYPRNFDEYRENTNHRSFESLPISEQFEFCERWGRALSGCGC